MLGTCPSGFWQYDDFEPCHKQRYLELYPLIGLLGACILYTVVSLAYAWFRPSNPEANCQINDDSKVVYRPPDAVDEHALIILRTRSVSDRVRLVLELILNVAQAAIAALLVVRSDAKKAYSAYAPLLPNALLALLVYTTFLSLYRLTTAKQARPLKASPFLQQAYIYTFLNFAYGIEWYSQTMHPFCPHMRRSLGALLILALTNWTILFSSPIGDEAAKLYTSNGSHPSTEPDSSLLRIMSCNWCIELIKLAQTKPLEQTDVLDLVEDDHVYRILKHSRQLPKRLSFFWRLTLTLYRPIILNIFFGCSAAFLKLTPTVFIQKLLQFLEKKDVPKGVAWLYVCCLGLSYLISYIAVNQAYYQGRKLSIGVRALIMGNVYEKAIYRRTTRHEKSDRDNETSSTDGDTEPENEETKFDASSTGAVINLMSVDAFKIADFTAYLHDFPATPLIVALSIFFLYRILGWSAIVAVLAMVALMPLNLFFAKRLNDVQEELMAVTDRRIEKTNEILDAIRIIKLYAWESRFTDNVLRIRDEELRLLMWRYGYWTANCFVFFGLPIIVVISSFWCFVRLQGGTLTTSVAFTALAVFSILRMPLNELAYIFTQLSSAMVSFRRIEEFLNSENTTKFEQLEQTLDCVEVIGFSNATFSWSSNKQEQEGQTDDSFKLRDLDVKFVIGDLNVVVGPTGSGKTSLLMALLGEMQKESGRVFLPSGNRRTAAVDPVSGLANSVAYVPQEAWLINGTIRANILFAHPFDQQRYNRVIDACELRRDLEILESGDRTLIGDKGIALSGGQKQRVSLARAMYSNSKHLLLDDCLSAVDSHTAEAIYHNALCGPISHYRTVILVSHNIALTIGKAATVTVVDNGRIKAHGSPAEVALSGNLGDDDLVSRQAQSAAASRVTSSANLVKLATGPNTVIEEDVEENAVEEEERATGRVPFSTYLNFLKEVATIRGMIIVSVAVIAVSVVEYIQTWWIRLWAKNSSPEEALTSMWSAISVAVHEARSSVFMLTPTNPPVNGTVTKEVHDTLRYYATGYALIGLLSIVLAITRELIVWYGGIRAARSIFRKLLFTVVHARTRFFDSTPSGRIVNRFTKDMEVIDQEISANLLWMMISVVDALQVAFVVSWVTPMLIPVACLVIYVFLLVGRAYLSAARELKRLESVSRSPIFQQFGETISGAVVIRAYGDTNRFIADNYAAVDETHRPYFWLWVSNRWLSFWCGMLSLAVCLSAAALIVAASDFIDPGMAGISLSLSTYFGDNVLWIVRMYAECEVSMNSVERVEEYMHIEQEPALVIPENRPPSSWPARGCVEFRNLSLRYSDDLPLVIKDVSAKIPGGKKVGVVGRTGAGKSTIITALFRLLEPVSGKVLIDDIDISQIGLHDLRSRLSIIPQEPTLFKGTIRSNIDLFGEYETDDIFRALSAAHLVPANTTAETALEAVATQNADENANVFFDLDHKVSEGGRNLSQGQRQLLCLARAVLRNPRVLLLDEATASIDYQTDAIIQETIRSTFSNSTILTIAHRLRTIADYDLILVLEKGEVAQFGHPFDLLQEKAGIFYGMCEKSGELETLLNLAQQSKQNS